MLDQSNEALPQVDEPKPYRKWIILGVIFFTLFSIFKIVEWQVGRSFTKIVKRVAGEQSVRKVTVSLLAIKPELTFRNLNVTTEDNEFKAEKATVQVPFSTFWGLSDVATKKDLKVYPPVSFTINLHDFSLIDNNIQVASMKEGTLLWSGKMDDLVNVLQQPLYKNPWSFNLSIKDVRLNPASVRELLNVDIPPYMLGQNYHFQIEWLPSMRKLSLKKVDWNSGDYVASIHGELLYDTFTDTKVPRAGTLYYKMRGKYRLDGLEAFDLPIHSIEVDQVDLFGAMSVDQGEWKPSGKTQWELSRFRMRYNEQFKNQYGLVLGLFGFTGDILEVDQFKLSSTIALSRLELERMDLTTRGLGFTAEAQIDLKEPFLDSQIRKSKIRVTPKSDQIRAGMMFLQNLTGTQFAYRNEVYTIELEGKLSAPKVKPN